MEEPGQDSPQVDEPRPQALPGLHTAVRPGGGLQPTQSSLPWGGGGPSPTAFTPTCCHQHQAGPVLNCDLPVPLPPSPLPLSDSPPASLASFLFFEPRPAMGHLFGAPSA
jgi:hypothetical protein